MSNPTLINGILAAACVVQTRAVLSGRDGR